MDRFSQKRLRIVPSSNSPVPPDLRSVVYYYGISQSGVEEWDKAFRRLQETNVASERRKLMYGLAGSPEPWVLNRHVRSLLIYTREA